MTGPEPSTAGCGPEAGPAGRRFFDGLAAGFLVASGVALAGAVVAAVALPARPPSGSVPDPREPGAGTARTVLATNRA